MVYPDKRRKRTTPPARKTIAYSEKAEHVLQQ